MVRGEIDEKAADIQTRPFMAELWKLMGKNAKLKEKQKWSEESSTLKTHENCVGSISLTLRTRNTKKPSRMLARNWKRQWILLCLARQARTIRIVGMVINPMKPNQKVACILEASESARLRMGESLPTHHEDHIAGKGDKSLQHYNLVHKFIPMPQAMKITAGKAAMDKESENLDETHK